MLSIARTQLLWNLRSTSSVFDGVRMSFCPQFFLLQIISNKMLSFQTVTFWGFFSFEESRWKVEEYNSQSLKRKV